MKTPNYLAKLPQEATIKSIQVRKNYDLISLDVPMPSQRLCPHCGSNDSATLAASLSITVSLFLFSLLISISFPDSLSYLTYEDIYVSKNPLIY